MTQPTNPATQESWHQLFHKLNRDPIVGVAVGVLILLYLGIALAGFLAPYSETWSDRGIANAPPTPVYTLHPKTHALTWPYVLCYAQRFDPATDDVRYLPVDETMYPLRLFVKGDPYKLFGFIPMTTHLAGVEAPASLNLLGADMNGRDTFSRLLFGGQISMTIGFLSLFIAFPIGLIYGGISGYFGGWVDNALMRMAEIVMSIPSLYLLISLAAILPPQMSSSARFAMVTLILAAIGWAGLSRVIRGMVLSIKNQEFIEAGRAMGMGPLGIIIHHVLPQTASYVIVAITLGVPGYLLAESGLSFLGLGIQQPDASWGNMLKEAQEITNLMTRPWMLAPGVLIFLAVLAFNVLGDAVRDVLDPKSYVKGRG